MFKAEVNPVTRFVSVVALTGPPGCWMPMAIMAITTAQKILMNAKQD
jgi:hypothetical protein